MTFTSTTPTTPGFYAWKPDKRDWFPALYHVFSESGRLVARNQKLAEYEPYEPIPNTGLWCRLVPAEEVVKLNTEIKLLMEIVEGVRCERWNSNGRRLKDTPEWCAFYVAYSRANRIAEGLD